MRGWIQVGSNGMPVTRNMYCLYAGFRDLGIETKTYTAGDIFAKTLPYDADEIFVGHIDRCKTHIKKISGYDIPPLDYPTELLPFAGRNIWKSTLGTVYKSIVESDGSIQPTFIKSVAQKSFTGFVCRSFSDFVANCTGHDHSEEIFVSEIVEFVSEYRAYIHRHSISSCLRYKGPYHVAPDKNRVDDMLYAVRNANMPVAYSLDVGVTKQGETLLVECNDGFALGNYGQLERDYAEMHKDRWYQMLERGF